MNESSSASDEVGELCCWVPPQLKPDWTPYHELEEALDHVRWLVQERWPERRRDSAGRPIAPEILAALAELRPQVEESLETWGRLSRSLPAEEWQL